MNPIDYTREQLAAVGAMSMICDEYETCQCCPLECRKDDCTMYALSHPEELLQGVKSWPPVTQSDNPDKSGQNRTSREECLEKAKAAVTGQRENDYGKPEDNFETIAKLWSAYIENQCFDEVYLGVDAQDVANMMILLKMGRVMSGTATADSYADIAGYAACGCEIATKTKE